MEDDAEGGAGPINAVDVPAGAESYEGERTAIEAATDADGKATVSFRKPGVYMLETRYPGRAASDAAPAARSWLYTLSFEVTP